MAVIVTRTWEVKQGAQTRVTERMALSKQMHERHGAKVRAWVPLAAG